MLRRDDPLELLLPEADARELRRARDVTHFLRLLANDASAQRASSVHVDLERARGELARADRERVERAHVELLRHHLRALLAPESFAWFGEPELDVASAWRVLDDVRADSEGLATVPAPGETPERVAERLVESFARAGGSDADVGLWRARLAHAACGPREGERAYRSRIDGAASPLPQPIARALVAGVAEALLDRGAVREARAWLYEHLALTGADPRLRQLLAWARLCAGDAAGARSVLVGQRPWSGPLPSALIDLRAGRPEWVPCLAGRTPRCAEVPRSWWSPRDRGTLGAAVLAVFTFDPRSGATPFFTDAAPALRARMRAWCAERDGAWAMPGEREHVLVVEARTVVEHADDPNTMRGAWDRGLARAVAVAPFLDEEGEVRGWVHLEFEHHLVPSTATLRALADAWRAETARGASAELVELPPAPLEDLPESCDPRDAPLAAVFHELARNLGWKTVVRRWCGFTVRGGALSRVASGGEAQGLSLEKHGRRRALERALTTGGRVAFDEPDPRLAACADAGSGVVFPLRVDGGVVGLFAVESSRRRDFRPVDLDAAQPHVESAAWSLRIAQMRAWHTARFGFDPWFDASRPDLRAFGRTLRAAARSRAAVQLRGPAGVGKLVVARWLHFESARASEPFRVVACGAHAAGTLRARIADGGLDGTVVLDDVDELPREDQEALLRVLEGGDGVEGAAGGDARVRWLATTRAPLEAAAEAGRMRPDLARVLDRLALAIPPLAARREDLPPLVEHLARRFAAVENLPVTTFADDAVACLWRQPWKANVRELEGVVYKLALLQPGREVGSAELGDLRRAFGLAFLRRLPSRHPERDLVVSALRTTRKPGGRINKTRAALYLGWDPDTLVSRMSDLQLREDALPEARGWYALDGDECASFEGAHDDAAPQAGEP